MKVPDIIDDVIDNTCTFTFCLDNIPDILINPDQLKTLLTEAVQNACEASDCTGEITLITRKSNNYVITEIINNGGLPSHDDSSYLSDYIKLSRPFYSTKSGHIGVGLSIIHQICYPVTVMPDSLNQMEKQYYAYVFLLLLKIKYFI